MKILKTVVVVGVVLFGAVCGWCGNPEVEEAIAKWDQGNYGEAFSVFLKYKDGDDYNVMTRLGLGMIFGVGGEYKTDEGIAYLENAAEHDNEDALQALADLYESGQQIPMDRNRAVDYLERYSKLTGDRKPYIDICYRIGMEYIFRKDNREGLLFLQLAADAGDAESAYQVSKWHENAEMRGRYALKAAQGGMHLAYLDAGYYLYSINEYYEALKMFLGAAEDGIPEAMVNVALMYRKGIGCKADEEKYVEWMNRAAEARFSSALLCLGSDCLEKYDADPSKDSGSSTHPMLAKAYAYIANAWVGDSDPSQPARKQVDFLLKNYIPFDKMRLDCPEMEFAKGVFSIMYGTNDEADTAKSHEFLKAAAEHGSTEALIILGNYNFNLHTLESVKESMNYCKKAVALGCDNAEKQLCNYGFKIAMDEADWLAILQKQADKGYGLACINLGDYYFEEENYEKMAEYYIKAAKNGDYQGLNQLIDIDREKPDLVDDDELALLLKQAIDSHSPETECWMGLANCPNDNEQGYPRQARTYLIRAIMDGNRNQDAFGQLGIFYLYGNMVRKDPDFASSLLQSAIDEGGYQYCIFLGDWLNGLGCPGEFPDSKRAKAIYELGAENGSAECQERLNEFPDESQKTEMQ